MDRCGFSAGAHDGEDVRCGHKPALAMGPFGRALFGKPVPVPWAFNAQGVPKAVPPFELLYHGPILVTHEKSPNYIRWYS